MKDDLDENAWELFFLNFRWRHSTKFISGTLSCSQNGNTPKSTRNFHAEKYVNQRKCYLRNSVYEKCNERSTRKEMIKLEIIMASFTTEMMLNVFTHFGIFIIFQYTG